MPTATHVGHWPQSFAKGKGKASSASTAWFKHIAQAMQHLTDAATPLEGIFRVVIQQAGKLTVAPEHKVCALRVGHGKVQVARRTGEKWHVVMTSKVKRAFAVFWSWQDDLPRNYRCKHGRKYKPSASPSNMYRERIITIG